MKLYKLAYRFHIISDDSDETYRQFSTALAESQALEESDRMMSSLTENADSATGSAAQQ